MNTSKVYKWPYSIIICISISAFILLSMNALGNRFGKIIPPFHPTELLDWFAIIGSLLSFLLVMVLVLGLIKLYKNR